GDVNAIFKPGEGDLWKFYDQKLRRLLTKQDSNYVAAGSGSPSLQPEFVAFFNQMAAFSNALYAGTTDPHFTYSLRPVQSEGIERVTLTIDGQSITHSGVNGAASQFTWPGMPPGVRATVKLGQQDARSIPKGSEGLWGVFRFFAQFQKSAGPDASMVEWPIEA